MNLPPINMLWIGPQLGRIEYLSIVSFLAAGHQVRLHSYERVANVPRGVEHVDASGLMPFETAQALRHRKTASYALASDYYRYKLQEAGAGVWTDLDMICLAPVRIQDPALFGWESDRYINGAILYLEAGHPVIEAALASFKRATIPDWVPLHKAAPFHLRRKFGREFGPADLPRGVYGPKALTALAKRFDLTGLARPVDIFYPLHPRRARSIFEPGTDLESIVRPETLTIHLWNEKLGPLKSQKPPGTSAMAALCRRFGV